MQSLGSQKGSLVNRPTSIDEGGIGCTSYRLDGGSRYITEVSLSGRKRPPPLPRWATGVDGFGKRPFSV